jgi:hypothetical protein
MPWMAVSLCGIRRTGAVLVVLSAATLLFCSSSLGAAFFTTTEIASGTKPTAIIAGDFTNDGIPDLVTANYGDATAGSGTVRVLTNDGAGHFAAQTAVSVGLKVRYIAAGHIYPQTGGPDGNLDLAVVREGVANIKILRGNGAGGFSGSVTLPVSDPTAVAIRDLDHDGHDDIIVARRAPGKITIFWMNSAGTTFNSGVDFDVNSAPTSVVAANIKDTDDYPDIIVGNQVSPGTVSILKNRANGQRNASAFDPIYTVSTGPFPASLAAVDLDGNGYDDLVAGSLSGSPSAPTTISVLFNTGGGIFTSADTYNASHAASTTPDTISVAIADMDADGRPDLVIANKEDNAVDLLFNIAQTPYPTFGNRAIYGVEYKPQAVVALKLQGATDGLPDLATANFASTTVSTILISSAGTRDARRDYLCGGKPLGIRSGLLDGDSSPDLVVADSDPGANAISILMNDGAGAFTNTTLPAGSVGDRPWDVVVADLGGSSSLDIGAVTRVGHQLLLWENSAASPGTFLAKAPITLPTGTEPRSIVAGDLDGDGDLDLAIACWGTNTVALYRNDGSFTFALGTVLRTGINPRAVLAFSNGADLPWIVTSNEVDSEIYDDISIFKNNGNFSFTLFDHQETGNMPQGMAAGDFDHQNGTDIAVVHQNTFNTEILWNDGTGRFGVHTSITGTGNYLQGITTLDSDMDGWLDLVVVSESNETTTLLRNDASMSARGFTKQSAYRVGDSSHWVEAADYDGRNGADLAVTNLGSASVSILRHTSPSSSLFGESIVSVVAEPTRERAALHLRRLSWASLDGELEIRVPVEGWLSVDVFDLGGRHMARLAERSTAAGTLRATVVGPTLPTGVYLLRAMVNGWQETQRLLVLH